MKRWQLIVAILLAVALMTVLALFLSLGWGRSPASPAEPTARQPLAEIKMSEVVRLTVRVADGRECRLEQDAQSNWYLVAPLSARANQNYVVWYLEDLLGTESSSLQPVSKIDLAKAGLVTPTATITLGLRDGGERALEVGAYAPQYLAYYVRMDDQVCLIPWDIVERATRMLDAPPVEQAP